MRKYPKIEASNQSVLYDFKGFTLLCLALVGALSMSACGGGAGGAGASNPTVISPNAQISAASNGTTFNWSSSEAWGGSTPPTAGSLVVIPAGKRIVLDVNPPALAGIVVEGALIASPERDLQLTAGYILVKGQFAIGTAHIPFTRKATITLTGGSTQSVEGMGTRGLLVMGGVLDLYGVAPTVAWTQLNANAASNTSSLTLKTPVSWSQGDNLVIAPTDFFGMVETQKIALSSSANNSTAITLAQPLGSARWGVLQHVTNTGMSLTPDLGFIPPAAPFPTVLDERAEVGNLTRNIVIESVNDIDWSSNGFGAQIMAMGTAAMHIDGVELRRVGQAGKTGRYPIHWHRMSYDNVTGAPLPDTVGQFVRNSSISGSMNRCVVVHATNGVTVQNNICHDIQGHAFFLEDAVERRNTFENNLVLKVRNPPAGTRRLQVHEGPTFEGGSSGFWLTNPDNVIRGNVAADTEGNGFWMAFPEKPLGLSASVLMKPNHVKHGVFEYNTAHSSGKPGVMIEWVPIDGAGNLTLVKYVPTSDEGIDRYAANRVRFELKRNTVYKSKQGAYRNRVSAPDYLEWVTADNEGTYFSGSGDDGRIQRHLAVGASLNNANESPKIATEPRVIFASYHSTFGMTQNVIVNVPFVAGKSSGAFKTDDYYITGTDKGTIRNSGNVLINSSPGFRYLPPSLLPAVSNEHWALSGALWDPYGYWGAAGQYTVYDVPFLTAGAVCQNALPAGSNGKTCNGEYFGVGDMQTDFDSGRYLFRSAIDVTRQDASGTVLGTWTVGDGTLSWKLGQMRHFSARSGSEYILRFPGKNPAKRFETTISNAWRTTDTFVMAVSYGGRINPTVYTVNSQFNRNDAYTPTGPSNRRDMTVATSLAEVRANTVGDKYWIDAANQLIWFKYKGGLSIPANSVSGTTDADLYHPMAIVINGE